MGQVCPGLRVLPGCIYFYAKTRKVLGHVGTGGHPRCKQYGGQSRASQTDINKQSQEAAKERNGGGVGSRV